MSQRQYGLDTGGYTVSRETIIKKREGVNKMLKRKTGVYESGRRHRLICCFRTDDLILCRDVVNTIADLRPTNSLQIIYTIIISKQK